MSLDSFNNLPISPLRALIAVHLTACTVYRKAMFSSICNLLMCFLFKYILFRFDTISYQTLKQLKCSQQYGFTKNSSTELAALEVIDRLINQLNKQKIPINFYLDLTKAFDSLCHYILL